MRLIDARTLILKEFPSAKQAPPYAILSHTWQDGEEVLFEEMTPEIRSSPASRKSGFAKIEKTCKLAQMHRRKKLDYVWVDTCCINKSSSAELSEAINSMFQWYKQAYVCFVYLDDVEVENAFEISSDKKPKWFTRGWTLQELIQFLQ
jgi:hypothetical protein